MLYDHAHAMRVKLCKANTRGVTATVRFATATSGSFGSGVGLSMKTSLFGWSRYPEVSIKGSGIQVKRRHGERDLTKFMNPGSGRIGGCPGTGYTKSRTTLALSFEGSIASLMCYATSVWGSASSTSTIPLSDALGAIRYRGSAWLISGATLHVW